MRDRYAIMQDGSEVAVCDLPTHFIMKSLCDPRLAVGATVSKDEVRLRLEIELIARSHGWPTKRSV